jgi:hypothetical protein
MIPVTCRFRDPTLNDFYHFFCDHGKLGHNGGIFSESNVRFDSSVPEQERDSKKNSAAHERNGLLQNSENNAEINKQAPYQPIKTFYTIVLPSSSPSFFIRISHGEAFWVNDRTACLDLECWRCNFMEKDLLNAFNSISQAICSS